MVVYYAALSLDGRIAGPDHDLSFLQTLDGGKRLLDFYAGVDSLIMGARTWDFMVAHGSWPYAGKQTWIVTHAEGAGPLEGAVVETYAGDLAELVSRIGAGARAHLARRRRRPRRPAARGRPARRADPHPLRPPSSARRGARGRRVPAAPVHAHGVERFGQNASSRYERSRRREQIQRSSGHGRSDAVHDHRAPMRELRAEEE
jgi:hypothetical protein